MDPDDPRMEMPTTLPMMELPVISVPLEDNSPIPTSPFASATFILTTFESDPKRNRPFLLFRDRVFSAMRFSWDSTRNIPLYLLSETSFPAISFPSLSSILIPRPPETTLSRILQPTEPRTKRASLETALSMTVQPSQKARVTWPNSRPLTASPDRR